ncbi:MAG TPA: threonine aldolase family protein [Candidatus Obscuribacterales bacterium]
MKPFRIDLYSDTQTRPTAEMRKAIAAAEVGDEQNGEDPTIEALRQRICDLLGTEDAVFLPSGTMANEIALLVHCRHGDEVIAHETSHVINFEGGAPAAFAGVMFKPLAGPRGLFDAQALMDALHDDNRYAPPTRLVVVEQTANLGGGTVWPIEQMREVAKVARRADLSLHMDGARLMNAVIASGHKAAEYAALFDTVFMDFTKGLGAPFGAVLAGRKEHIRDAWRWKQRMGGSMRQAGMMAAGCLYALDNHVERLAEDHANAKLLRDSLLRIPDLHVFPVDTNLVYFDVAALGLDAESFNQSLEPYGLRVSVLGKTLVRAVTHLDVSKQDVEEAAEIITQILRQRTAGGAR